MTTIIGYGSLLSEASARETAPSLTGFRLVQVSGYRRIFNKVGIAFFERGHAAQGDVHIASCATRISADTRMIGSAFECSDEDLVRIFEREHRFRWVQVRFSALDGSGAGEGRMCSEYNDVDYRLNKCVTDAEYERRVGRFYNGRIWRDDILPNRTYLGHCLRAAATQGQQVLDNFQDTTFLADGVTSIRSYLKASPDGVSDQAYSYRKDS